MPRVANRVALLALAATVLLLVAAPSAAADVTVVPYGSQYRYQVYNPNSTPADWASPSFVDSSFPVASAPFGSGGLCPIQSEHPPNTYWPVVSELLLRREFTLPAGASGLKIFIAVDNDVRVAVNGVELTSGWVLHEGCAILDRFTMDVSDSFIRPGTNLLAVLGRERGGNESYLDVRVTRASPTAVSVRSLVASRLTNGILIRWRTASEAETLGFNVYRQSRGKLVKLNPTLIPSVFGGTVSGHAYSWLDRSAPRGAAKYRLQAVSLSGKRSWVGSAAIGG